ncbi:MAG: response regulator [Alphaproteobacteria bacterium]|nr:response regulator [Alphaproteobacteria bacterium]
MKNDTPRRDREAETPQSRLGAGERGPLFAADDFLVVAIGSSAGGLEACRKFLTALPAHAGMAFILVQHLEPNHPSMMVDLLASHTKMVVQQATEGMQIEPDNLYVIPPGAELSVSGGALHISQPTQRHGARLPFDILLQSAAAAFGNRAVAIVLSGSGSDGSAALQSVKSQFGLVIAQDPGEAAFDGMPRSAIDAGVVDLVLPVADIPQALADYDRRRTHHDHSDAVDNATSTVEARLPEIIALLRQKTPHDFTGYKPGTLLRRIERRMALVAGGNVDVDTYIGLLRSEPAELGLLADDILINVTRFFRDPEIFNLLAETVIPEVVARHAADRTLRVWVPGCSTGEEAYSLVILILEHTARIGSGMKLQVFASDADADAIVIAREGRYPESIAADISPERLKRFFCKDKQGYRVLPELRAAVIFACQDVLIDPPFSRLDLISCRNLLIYLGPAAQTRVIDLFHFALREGGILLLGNAESIDAADSRFETVSEAGRIYRHVARCRPGEVRFAIGTDDGVRGQRVALEEKPRPRPAELAELCRRMVIENFAPAAVLINSRHECLYSVGRTERFLRVVPGHPTNDLLDMAPQAMRTRLRMVIAEAAEKIARAHTSGVRVSHMGSENEFTIDVIPVPNDSEQLLLVCFTEVVKEVHAPASGVRETPPDPADMPRVAALEIENEATRSELRHVTYELEQSREERKVVSEEASSVAEEYQSTNEELLTSKEELQSLNEELTALNGQLHETLEQQKTTSDYLQNILYSTDVATLFLDANLRIRFFTPATKQLFNVIPGDIGRPLGDLSSLSADHAALDDSRTVLRTLAPIEREIETQRGVWFMRRILPYRTHDNGVEGVVITFTDISERKRIAEALLAATQQAQTANVAKSRFLAVASHDLRQPLQSLVLIHGLLAKQISGEKPRRLLARLDETLSAMSGMLNTLLDINQIEVGAVEPKVIRFPINELLTRLRDEFSYHAHSRGLTLRVVPSSLNIASDPRLLEQMLRNLLSNAVKYTERGKVLLGCRRREGVVSMEVWDTGIGIPKSEFTSIFEEYYQLGNPARQRSHGLGLGLAIVQRLANLLGHRIDVRSLPGKGSGFAIEIEHSPDQPATDTQLLPDPADLGVANDTRKTGIILVVEDDPEVCNLLEDFLADEGHKVLTASDGIAAESLLFKAAIRPDLMIADYNLPNGMNGVELTSRVRAWLDQEIPVIVLTGDISIEALRNIGLHACVHLNKPVKIAELEQTIQRLLAQTPTDLSTTIPLFTEATGSSQKPHVYVVDDDFFVRDHLRTVLEAEGWVVKDFGTTEAFLKAFSPGSEACLLIDAYLPGMSGIQALDVLREAPHQLPAIMMTGHSDVSLAIEAMKSGAMDFIEKPVGRRELIAVITRALELSRDRNKLIAWRTAAASQIADLTQRQRQIMELVLAGHPSKNIAADLGISQRTVENHRAAIMTRTGVKSLPELARLAVAAASSETIDDVAGENLTGGGA